MLYLPVLILISSTTTTTTTTTDSNTLKMVHLVYRHGARSPTHFYPTDPYQEKDWPDGGGRLTQIGMNMEYNLGKLLKKRYITEMDFISEKYLHKHVYIRSSDSERCLQSAESQLAGLYPPTGQQVWNTAIPWQPVPVHTVPWTQDTMLRPDDVPCPRLNEIWKQQTQSVEYQGKLKENKDLLIKLTNYTGMEVTFDNLDTIADSTICEKTQGWKPPKWTDALWKEILSIFNWLFLYKYQGNDELGRLLGGTLLEKINSDMKEISERKNSAKLFKLNMYSGHDTSLLALSTALDVDIGLPGFASCIMIELHYSNSSYSVRMFYKKNNTDYLQPLKLKQCSFNCTLAEFIKFTKSRTVKDRSKMCNVSGSSFELSNFTVTVFFGCIITLLLVVSMVCVARRSSLSVQFGYKHNVQLTQDEETLLDS